MLWLISCWALVWKQRNLHFISVKFWQPINPQLISNKRKLLKDAFPGLYHRIQMWPMQYVVRVTRSTSTILSLPKLQWTNGHINGTKIHIHDYLQLIMFDFEFYFRKLRSHNGKEGDLFDPVHFNIIDVLAKNANKLIMIKSGQILFTSFFLSFFFLFGTLLQIFDKCFWKM